MSRTSKKKSQRTFGVRWRNGFEISLVGLLVVLFFNLLSWPAGSADESLDGSWQLILTYALEQNLHFGEDVIFTYGPLGGLSSFSYSGYNHAGKFAFELFMRLSVIVFLFRFLPNLQPYVKLGLLFLYLFLLQILPDAYETFFFFGLVSWTTAIVLEKPLKRRKPLALLSVGVGYLVVASLVKFTLLIAAVFCLVLVVFYLWMQGRRTEVLGATGGYALGMLALWSLLGQRFADIPNYLVGSYQVAKGYAMSMHLPMEEGAFKYFLFLLLSSISLLAVVLKEQLRVKWKLARLKEPWVPLLLLYAGFFFMVWKQGVVRSDGHIWQFICYVPLVAWFLYPVVKKQKSKVMFGALSVVQFLLMVVAVNAFYPDLIPKSPQRFWKQTADGVNGFLNPGISLDKMRQSLANKKDALRNQYPMLDSVGERSVDVVGDQQGLAILAGLNYSPRPVFQNYVANNAYLQDLNASHWRGADTPEFVIQSLDAIDGTLPTQSDSQTILNLLSHYQHQETNGRFVLLSKRATHAEPILDDPTVLELKVGERISLPKMSGAVQAARFDISLNLLGRIRAFFVKPPILYLKTELSDGSSYRHRLNPVTVERGFLLTPSVTSASELWAHRESKEWPFVKHITVEAERGEAFYFSGKSALILFSISWQDLP